MSQQVVRPQRIASKLQTVVASDTLRIVNASLNGSELILTELHPVNLIP